MRPWLAAAALVLSAAAASAATMVSRGEWGARAPRADISTWEAYDIEPPQYDRIVLHITAMGKGEGVTEAKRIQDFQMDERGFSDIAYNFLIDSAGTVFAGRSLDFVPAHAGRSVEGDQARDIRLDPDHGAIGIAFSADPDDALSIAQEDAAIALIEWLKSNHPVKQIMTHAEVGGWLEAAGLTLVRPVPPEGCPGAGSVDSIARIRRHTDPDFDEAVYRALFAP